MHQRINVNQLFATNTIEIVLRVFEPILEKKGGKNSIFEEGFDIQCHGTFWTQQFLCPNFSIFKTVQGESVFPPPLLPLTGLGLAIIQ